MDAVEKAVKQVTESSEPAGGMTDGCVEGSLLLGLVLFSAACHSERLSHDRLAGSERKCNLLNHNTTCNNPQSLLASVFLLALPSSLVLLELCKYSRNTSMV